MTFPEFDRDLQSRLQSLDSDLAGARMAGPSSARKRAAQRTRRQVTGTALAGVAAVAAGTIIIFRPSLPAADEVPPAATTPPSETATEQPTQPPTPTETPTTDAGDASIPENALMTADDIQHIWAEVPPWAPADPSGDVISCVPDLSDIGVAHERAAYSTPIEGVEYESRASHDVVLVDRGSAEQTFTDLRTAIEECAPVRDDGFPRQIEQSDGTGLGDDAWLVRYWAEIPDDLFGWKVNIALAREGDAISMTVVYWADTEVHEPPDMETPVNAAQRMCDAMFGVSCVDDPQFPDIDLEPYEAIGGTDPGQGGESDAVTLADDPFLTVEDVNPVGSYDDGFEVGENSPPEAYVQELGYVCLDDFNAIGAIEWQHQVWDKGIQASVDNAVIQFPSTVEADGWILDYTAISDRCASLGQVGDYTELTEYGVIDVDGADNAIAWSKYDTPPGVDSFFGGVGIALRENVGVIVRLSSMADPGNWEEYVTERLAVALERAVDPSSP